MPFVKCQDLTPNDTSGDVKLYGRVSSLIEVGTGFHPELTGRENIFLNGAILGMQKEEIKNVKIQDATPSKQLRAPCPMLHARGGLSNVKT